MIRISKQNFTAASLLLFTFLAFSIVPVYATSNSTNNSTNSTLAEQQSQLNQQELTIISKGCGEGYGYNANDPSPICEPVDKIGQGPPKDMAFCAALGCPYNPPADSELSTADEVPEAVEPEPQPEADTESESNGDDSDENEEGNDSSEGEESESESEE